MEKTYTCFGDAVNEVEDYIINSGFSPRDWDTDAIAEECFSVKPDCSGYDLTASNDEWTDSMVRNAYGYRVICSRDGMTSEAAGGIMYSIHDAVKLFGGIAENSVGCASYEFKNDLDAYDEATVLIERCKDPDNNLDGEWETVAKFDFTLESDL